MSRSLRSLDEQSFRGSRWLVPVGPLSGKTGIDVIVWPVFWPVFHLLWRKKDLPFAAVWKLALVLILLGFLGTFPPVFELVARH